MGHPNKGRHKTDTLTEQDEHSNQHPTLQSYNFFEHAKFGKKYKIYTVSAQLLIYSLNFS